MLGEIQMKVNKKNGVIRLSKDETKVWEDGGPDGNDYRRSLRILAKSIVRPGMTVEIYASKSEGGWTADVVE
jgi:hypothetical protein